LLTSHLLSHPIDWPSSKTYVNAVNGRVGPVVYGAGRGARDVVSRNSTAAEGQVLCPLNVYARDAANYARETKNEATHAPLPHTYK